MQQNTNCGTCCVTKMKYKKTHDVTQMSLHICDIENGYADNYNEMEQISMEGGITVWTSL